MSPILLVGEKPTRRKVDLAKEFGVKIISLDQIYIKTVTFYFLEYIEYI